MSQNKKNPVVSFEGYVPLEGNVIIQEQVINNASQPAKEQKKAFIGIVKAKGSKVSEEISAEMEVCYKKGSKFELVDIKNKTYHIVDSKDVLLKKVGTQ